MSRIYNSVDWCPDGYNCVAVEFSVDGIAGIHKYSATLTTETDGGDVNTVSVEDYYAEPQNVNKVMIEQTRKIAESITDAGILHGLQKFAKELEEYMSSFDGLEEW